MRYEVNRTRKIVERIPVLRDILWILDGHEMRKGVARHPEGKTPVYIWDKKHCTYKKRYMEDKIDERSS